MIKKPEDIAEKFLGVPYESLDERTKKVARHIAGRKHIARNTAKEFDSKTTLGQRAADAVATFGGVLDIHSYLCCNPGRLGWPEFIYSC